MLLQHELEFVIYKEQLQCKICYKIFVKIIKGMDELNASYEKTRACLRLIYCFEIDNFRNIAGCYFKLPAPVMKVCG